MSSCNISAHIEKIARLPFLNEKQRMRRLCIYLVLGMDCNMGCTYCFYKNRINSVDNVGVTDEFIKFLQVELPSKIPPGTHIPIQFWGGEPLMYMDKIKYIVDSVKHLSCYKLLIVSNGRLLDSSTVDFCNLHNIGVGISHDGANSIDIRGYDAVVEKYSLINAINNFLGFSSVLSEQNSCVDAITSYFSNNRLLDDNHKNVRIYPQIPTDMQHNINVELIRTNTEKLLANMTQKLNNGVLSVELGMIEGSIANYMFYQRDPGSVHNIGNSMRVNMTTNGRLFYTHGAEFELGNLDTPLDVLYEKYKMTRESMFKKWEECEQCEAFPLCMGGQLVGVRAGKNLCTVNEAYYGTICRFMKEINI